MTWSGRFTESSPLYEKEPKTGIPHLHNVDMEPLSRYGEICHLRNVNVDVDVERASLPQ
jgi:hypothetical protein